MVASVPTALGAALERPCRYQSKYSTPVAFTEAAPEAPPRYIISASPSRGILVLPCHLMLCPEDGPKSWLTCCVVACYPCNIIPSSTPPDGITNPHPALLRQRCHCGPQCDTRLLVALGPWKWHHPSRPAWGLRAKGDTPPGGTLVGYGQLSRSVAWWLRGPGRGGLRFA